MKATRGTECARDPADVGVGVCHGVGLKRDDVDRVSCPGAGGGLDIGEAHRAHFAVVLRDDDVGGKRFERVAVDAIDREAVAHDLLHAGVDLAAAALHLELGRRECGQARDLRREVALVAATDEPVVTP